MHHLMISPSTNFWSSIDISTYHPSTARIASSQNLRHPQNKPNTPDDTRELTTRPESRLTYNTTFYPSLAILNGCDILLFQRCCTAPANYTTDTKTVYRTS
jgi:hypothetical protein